jgi:2'-5' RNA ligase
MAVATSAKLAEQFGSSIRLDPVNSAIPHITLHQFAIPADNLASLEERVAKIARETYTLDVVMTTCGQWGDGGIWWDTGHGETDLWRLHSKLVPRIVELQDSYLLPHLTGMLTGEIPCSPKEREAFLRYGSPFANPKLPDLPFRPHITVGKVHQQATASAIQAANEHVKNGVRFNVKSIHITELGPHGTCPASLKAFGLQST